MFATYATASAESDGAIDPWCYELADLNIDAVDPQVAVDGVVTRSTEEDVATPVRKQPQRHLRRLVVGAVAGLLAHRLRAGPCGEHRRARCRPFRAIGAPGAELARAIGIAMLGAALVLALSAVMIWRGLPAGTAIAMVVGAIYVGVSLLAALAGSWWDVGFYGLAGIALIALAGALRWLRRQPDAPATT